MAFKLATSTRETTATTGTGAVITLGGLVPGAVQEQTFNNGLGVGNSTTYKLVSGNAVDWEEGIGSLTGATTFSRDTVLRNSAGTTSRINLSGTSRIWSAYSGEFVRLFLEFMGGTGQTAGKVLTIGGGGLPSFIAGAYPTWRRQASVIATVALPAVTYNNGTAGVGATLTANANGALTIDGTTTPNIVVGHMVLIAGQANQAHNGVYIITQFGSAGTPFILTRYPGIGDGADGFFDMGQVFSVIGGVANSHSLWQLTWNTTSPIVFGTDFIIFSQVGGTILGGLDSISNVDGNILMRSGGTWQAFKQPYPVAFSAPQTTAYTASQVIGHHPFSLGVTFPANFGAHMGMASQAGGAANATGSTAILVQKAVVATPNTWTTIGTITIGAGGVTPTFATTGGTAQTFAQGDRMRIVMPASPDATFIGFYANLIAFRT